MASFLLFFFVWGFIGCMVVLGYAAGWDAAIRAMEAEDDD